MEPKFWQSFFIFHNRPIKAIIANISSKFPDYAMRCRISSLILEVAIAILDIYMLHTHITS